MRINFTIIFLILFSLSIKTNAHRVILDVPYLNQSQCGFQKGCGYYSLAMVLSYYEGFDYPNYMIDNIAKTIKGNTRTNACKAVSAYWNEIVDYANKFEYYSEGRGKVGNYTDYEEYDWIQMVKNEIDNGFPVIALVHTDDYLNGIAWGNINISHRHWVVIIGYDEDNVYAHDPGRREEYGRERKVSWTTFLNSWENAQSVPYRCIIIHNNTIKANSPRNYEVNTPIPVLFNWNDYYFGEQCSNIEYRIQVSTTSQNWNIATGFTNSRDPNSIVVVNKNVGLTSDFKWIRESNQPGTYTTPKPSKTYYWTWRAFNPTTGEITNYSTPKVFTTEEIWCDQNVPIGDGSTAYNPFIFTSNLYVENPPNVNQNTTIFAEIVNEGDLSEAVTVTLKVNGEIVNNIRISSLHPEESKTIEFEYVFDRSGENEVSVLLSSENSEKDATSMVVNVETESNYFSVFPFSFEINSNQQQLESFIFTNCNYVLNPLVNWVSYSIYNDQLTIIVSENPNNSERAGYIDILSNGTKIGTITILQKGRTPYCWLESNYRLIASSTAIFNLNINSNVEEFAMVSNQTWVHVEKLSNNILKITCDENDSESSRNAIIDFLYEGKSLASFQIEQQKNVISTPYEEVAIPPNLGQLAISYVSTFPVSAYIYSDSQYWLKLIENGSVNGNGTIKFEYSSNDSYDSRNASILLSASNGDLKRIVIKQNACNPYINSRLNDFVLCENDWKSIQINTNSDSILWYDSGWNFIGKSGRDVNINSRTERSLYNLTQIFEGSDISFDARNSIEKLYLRTNNNVCNAIDSLQINMVFLNEPMLYYEYNENTKYINVTTNNDYDYYDWSICNSNYDTCNYTVSTLPYLNYFLNPGCYNFNLLTSYTKHGCTIDSQIDSLICVTLSNVPIEQDDISYKLYPNPASDFIYFNHYKPVDRILIFNSIGILVKTISSFKVNENINISNLNPGSYFLVAFYSDGTISNKHGFIKY